MYTYNKRIFRRFLVQSTADSDSDNLENFEYTILSKLSMKILKK